MSTTYLLTRRLSEIASSTDWSICRNDELALGGSLKFRAVCNESRCQALVKSEFVNTVLGEYFGSRLAHMLKLPRVPVQLIVMPDELVISHDGYGATPDGLPLGMPVGALIHWIEPACWANWLWEARSRDVQEAGIDVDTVARLKALSLLVLDFELCEFMVADRRVPFLVDFQESCGFDRWGHTSFDRLCRPSQSLLQKYLPDARQQECALALFQEVVDLPAERIAELCYVPLCVRQKLFRTDCVCTWQKEVFDHFWDLFRVQAQRWLHEF